MGKKRSDHKRDTTTQSGDPCWRELLAAAFIGLYPSDQNLEHMLDHLEQAT